LIRTLSNIAAHGSAPATEEMPPTPLMVSKGPRLHLYLSGSLNGSTCATPVKVTEVNSLTSLLVQSYLRPHNKSVLDCLVLAVIFGV
jgi:hypothetical protein